MGRPPVPVPPKYCERCGEPLFRHRFNGTLEGRSQYLRRRFCSLSCANTRDMVTAKQSRMKARRLMAAKTTSCEACGNSEAVHVHHVNRDPSDNRPENLQPLCKWCHQYWHRLHERLGRDMSTRVPRFFHEGR